MIKTSSSTSRPLRIAYVTETYPPEVNGVAMSTARIVEGLHAVGHDILLIRPRQGECDFAAHKTGLREALTASMPIPGYAGLQMGLATTRSVRRLLADYAPDVVHVTTEGLLGWAAVAAARQLALPVSSDFRTNFHAYSRHYGMGWLQRPILATLRAFHNRTQCTMVPTEMLRRELASTGFRNLQVVARGVDTQLFTPERRSQALRAQWGAGPDDLVVTSVGRIAAEKNLGAVIAAFDAIRRRLPGARLVLVGDGPLRRALSERHFGVHFAGQRLGTDLAMHYASADLFLFASLTETFGNVTVEAMASGLPVVAFDYAAAGQLIRPGWSGALAAYGDEAGFAHLAADLAEDSVRCRAMGACARITALELDWAATVARFESVLWTCLRTGSSNAGSDAAATASQRS